MATDAQLRDIVDQLDNVRSKLHAAVTAFLEVYKVVSAARLESSPSEGPYNPRHPSARRPVREPPTPEWVDEVGPDGGELQVTRCLSGSPAAMHPEIGDEPYDEGDLPSL